MSTSTGSLSSVITEVTSYLSPLWPGLTSLIGQENMQKHNAPPRVVWIPTADRFAGARLQKVEPRPIRTRIAGVAVHCWAVKASGDTAATGDLNATEKLVNDVIAGIHNACHGSYDVISATWEPQATGILGRACIVEFTIEVPITLQPQSTAVINAVGISQTVG